MNYELAKKLLRTGLLLVISLIGGLMETISNTVETTRGYWKNYD